MCTVSIIPLGDGLRLVCNRDESRTRPPAERPRLVAAGGLRAIMPLDSQAGGTWVAVNEAGLIFAVLNVNAAGSPGARCTPWRTRGDVIPPLLACVSLDEVARRMDRERYDQFRPFRLIAADCREVQEFHGPSRRRTRRALVAPLMFTSSGLGDWLVQKPRRRLFARLMRSPGTLVEKQDRFHAHRWRGRPEISIDMVRTDARTVSRTIASASAGEVRMAYLALPGDGSEGASHQRLTIDTQQLSTCGAD